MQIDNAFITRILELLKITVDEASRSIMDVYHKDTYDTETKSDGSPVTEADNRSNEIIIKSLKNISNDIPILTEEIYEKDLINTLPTSPQPSSTLDLSLRYCEKSHFGPKCPNMVIRALTPENKDFSIFFLFYQIYIFLLFLI